MKKNILEQFGAYMLGHRRIFAVLKYHTLYKETNTH